MQVLALLAGALVAAGCYGGVQLAADTGEADLGRDEATDDAPDADAAESVAEDAPGELPDLAPDVAEDAAPESGDEEDDGPVEVADAVDAEDAAPTCGDQCLRGEHTACTCDPADPCGWARNRACDAPACAEATAGPTFDDSIDCTGGACDRGCARYEHDACTCDPADPCGWSYDGYCDAPACRLAVSGSRFDDAEDCGGPPAALTFIATAVDDGLDNTDFDVFAQGFRRLGYRWLVRDADVNTAELAGYLGLGVTFLYHTGHGFPGGAATADGAITAADLSGAVAARHTIWATCLTLAEPWASAFGPTAESVLGYTDVSFDLADDEVARLFAESIGRGSTPMFAWYEANVPVSGLADRWAGAVREGAEIVEYSARSGRLPLRRWSPGPDFATWVPLDAAGRVLVSADLLDTATPFDGPAAARASREPAESVVGGISEAWSTLGPGVGSSTDAIATAESFLAEARGGTPAGATLDLVAAVEARRDGGAAQVVGWVVRWSRTFAGLPVRGNGAADHVAVLVGRDGVAAWSWWWPETATWTEDAGAGVLDAAGALRLAAEDLGRAAKGDVRLFAAEPVWGTGGPAAPDLVPAWRYVGDDGLEVVLDAVTGRIVR
ncbi:MAG: hypothetical protein HY905_27740 [Deltaproteobacteria bacterium]|nr:hypothetical protein [Deltaproteobacteria bacterium]